MICSTTKRKKVELKEEIDELKTKGDDLLEGRDKMKE